MPTSVQVETSYASCARHSPELRFHIWLRLDKKLDEGGVWGWLDQAEIRLTQPQLSRAGAWAELGNFSSYLMKYYSEEVTIFWQSYGYELVMV